jgi:tetratricopeptide (TPR) repeat protein
MEDIQTLIEKVKTDIQDEKSDEEILQSLMPFFGKDSQTDGEVAELLATIPHVKIAKLLQRMLEVSGDKKVRKVIKRSLYRLKSRGIAVEEIPPDKGKPILRPLQAEPAEGFGSAIDFLGQRLMLLVIPHAGRGLTVIQGIVSDIHGLVDFSGEEMARKGFKDFFKEIKKKSLFPIVEMEPSCVGFLLAQAYSLTLEKGRTPPQDYPRLKSEIEKMKKEYEKPLIYSYIQMDEIVEEERILRRAGDLLKADLFSTWRIEEDQIRPYADAVWEAEESKIVLNQIQKEARFQEIYQRALSELFPDEKRFLYKRRLEEMAYVLFKLGRQEEAKVSLSAAIDLEKPLNPIQPNPFLFQLVIKSIFTLLVEAYEKKAKEPSLIVKP